MNFSNTGSSSLWMAFTRIAVGIMFLFFAQYKLIHRDFAHGGYEKYVHSYVQESSVNFYKPVLNKTLATLQAQTSAFERAESVERLGDAVAVESLIRIHQAIMEDYPKQ